MAWVHKGNFIIQENDVPYNTREGTFHTTKIKKRYLKDFVSLCGLSNQVKREVQVLIVIKHGSLSLRESS